MILRFKNLELLRYCVYIRYTNKPCLFHYFIDLLSINYFIYVIRTRTLIVLLFMSLVALFICNSEVICVTWTRTLKIDLLCYSWIVSLFALHEQQPCLFYCLIDLLSYLLVSLFTLREQEPCLFSVANRLVAVFQPAS